MTSRTKVYEDKWGASFVPLDKQLDHLPEEQRGVNYFRTHLLKREILTWHG